MDGADEAARFLEAVTRDPLADAVRGQVEILAISAPARRGRWQAATLQLRATAPGMTPRTIEVEAVFDTRHWPAVGRVLPARISPTHAHAVDVVWEALRR